MVFSGMSQEVPGCHDSFMVNFNNRLDDQLFSSWHGWVIILQKKTCVCNYASMSYIPAFDNNNMSVSVCLWFNWLDLWHCHTMWGQWRQWKHTIIHRCSHKLFQSDEIAMNSHMQGDHLSFKISDLDSFSGPQWVKSGYLKQQWFSSFAWAGVMISCLTFI